MDAEELCDRIELVDKERWEALGEDKSGYRAPQVDIVTLPVDFDDYLTEKGIRISGRQVLTIDRIELAPDGDRVIIYVRP